MAWYLRNWYNLGLALAVLTLAYGVLVTFPTTQRILLLSFVLLLLHQFEEYGWPGGFPAFVNSVILGSDVPDRYPVNQLNSLTVNVAVGYPFYLLPLVFPQAIWLALAPMVFALLELVIHLVAGNGVARARYSPGLVTVLPWAAVSVWYLAEVAGSASATDWWLGLGYLILGVILALPVGTFWWGARRDSRHPFDPDELNRLARYGHLIHHCIHPHHT